MGQYRERARLISGIKTLGVINKPRICKSQTEFTRCLESWPAQQNSTKHSAETPGMGTNACWLQRWSRSSASCWARLRFVTIQLIARPQDSFGVAIFGSNLWYEIQLGTRYTLSRMGGPEFKTFVGCWGPSSAWERLSGCYSVVGSSQSKTIDTSLQRLERCPSHSGPIESANT